MHNVKGRAVEKTAFLEFSLADGTAFQGRIFIPIQGRLTDVLNDERKFLPVETADGRLLALSKSWIKHISTPDPEAAIYRGTNPYAILGVKEDASAEELKTAYHKLSMVNHPDRIKSFGLGDDYLELATLNMSRINNAYAQLSKKNGSAG